MATEEEMLITLAGRWSDDPLTFAQKAFEWGTGELTGMTAPDKWQTEVLTHIRDNLHSGEVIRVAVAAGHGVGKSALVAWLILWSLSTFPHTRGVVTANTESQLSTKTWAELAKWHRLCIFRDWFEMSATRIVSTQRGAEQTWRIDAIPWSENRPEAFAGLHNAGRRELVVFDEASAIADPIWEVTEGAMTDRDTQILWLAFGNPTRSSGRFFDCFHKLRHRWWTKHVDARDAAGSNKAQIQAWLEDYGEDSDFFKVRVRGVFPSQSSSQFISRADVDAAMQRQSQGDVGHLHFAAMVGVDVARFGDDSTVICTRVGRDATYPMKVIRKRDGVEVAEAVKQHILELRAKGFTRIFTSIDGTGIGAPICDILTHAGFDVEEVNFGANAQDQSRYRNRRCEIWGRMKDWIKTGILPSDETLAMDLTAPEYGYDERMRIVLERKDDMKKRGLPSPDRGDALALTFAQVVQESDDFQGQRFVVSPKPYNPIDAVDEWMR